MLTRWCKSSCLVLGSWWGEGVARRGRGGGYRGCSGSHAQNQSHWGRREHKNGNGVKAHGCLLDVTTHHSKSSMAHTQGVLLMGLSYSGST